ncbi:MAG: hypothetical protein KKH28_04800 [Elusimicrobia bacterium]|nr:hypothetical protein [Elusimicrobiota bacterium]
MEKEKFVQCVPGELVERLKQLLARLWDENNPAAVHLNAVMDEFAAGMKSLDGIVQEYESDYAHRLTVLEKQYKDKALLSEALKQKESELAEFKAKTAETEAEMNLKYAARMQELYDRINRKEKDMITRWEEKNRALDARISEVESDYPVKVRQLKLKEKALEDDFNSRKTELIKTFDRIRLEFEAREEKLSAAEKELSNLDKAGNESARKLDDLGEALKQKESELAEFKAKTAETEAEMNLKYTARMQELYDRINRKEMDLITRWEEKNKALDTRISKVESDYSAKVRQLKLKEKALEDDVNFRKAELNKTFDRIRLEFKAREEKLSAAEKKLPKEGGAG